MGNNRKAYRANGMVTFFIRKEFRPIFEKFIQNIEKDPRIEKQRHTNNHGVLSIAIILCMQRYNRDIQDYGYVTAPRPPATRQREVQQSETPSQAQNNEEVRNQ